MEVVYNMKLDFPSIECPPFVKKEEWHSHAWQLRNSLKTKTDFTRYFDLEDGEEMFFGQKSPAFKVQVTPYYAMVARQKSIAGKINPIKKIFIPSDVENKVGLQEMADPLGEHRFAKTPKLIHRYTDRVLLLVTDICATYCRYCTRKYHTAKGKPNLKNEDFNLALEYIRNHPEIREVILSGGDPLVLDDLSLQELLRDIRKIEHIEIIRIGSRVPVVNPFRITEGLAQILKQFRPVVLMLHFNHPKEITQDSKRAIDLLVDHGLMLMNQMVLLNGVNNHPAIVQALSRRLLYLGVKPYAMYQCDPSLGTDHLRTSISNSLQIVNQLWGRFSTLATPQFYIDIPGGGGKVPFHHVATHTHQFNKGFVGWDGIEGKYICPEESKIDAPSDWQDYQHEWNLLRNGEGC
jgi:lysine 2,3-aminomutase